jgi:ElaB/YqjD/DUF883 family membrane-anchored ribosome-binding protein
MTSDDWTNDTNSKPAGTGQQTPGAGSQAGMGTARTYSPGSTGLESQSYGAESTGSDLGSGAGAAGQAGAGSGLGSMVPSSVKSDAKALKDTVKGEFANVKAEAETQIGQLADTAKQQIKEVTENAKTMAAEQKNMVAGQLDSIGRALSRAADELEGENAPTAAYARTIADSVQQFTASMRDRSVDDLFGMVEDFGRRQPVAMMGVAALAGFAASRFLFASAQRRQQASGYGGDTGHAGTTSSSDYAADEWRSPNGTAGTGGERDTLGGGL